MGNRLKRVLTKFEANRSHPQGVNGRSIFFFPERPLGQGSPCRAPPRGSGGLDSFSTGSEVDATSKNLIFEHIDYTHGVGSQDGSKWKLQRLQVIARPGKVRQGKTRREKARRGKARRGKTRLGEAIDARRGKARQGQESKARQGEAR